MNIIIFEQKDLKTLYPFSINHASFEIKAGLYSNFEDNCLTKAKY